MNTAPGHRGGRHGTSTVAGPSGAPVNAQDLVALREALAVMVPAAVMDPDAPATSHPAGPEAIASPDGVEAEAIDRIAVLEQLKAAVSAAQIRETAALHAHRTTAEARRGVPVKRRGRGLGGEVGLARRCSPHTGSTEVRKAVNVAADLPNTLSALQAGVMSEAHAAAVERQTHWLDPGSRRAVDTHVAGMLGRCGLRDLTRAAQAEAATQDPEAAAERYDAARRERHVSVKASESTPGMAYLTALLPLEQAAACYQTLVESASRLIAEGESEREHVVDPTDGPRGQDQDQNQEREPAREGGPEDDEHGGRTWMQVLTDTLVERLTGQSRATSVPAEVHLVMTDTSLFGSTVPGSHAAATRAAWLPGFGPIPAPTARRLVANTEADVFLRRLYTAPESGQLAALDSQRRTFSGGLRRMIVIRDGTCRTPYCGAPIRHLDHATPYREGGPTSYQNGSGLCVRCNLTKEHPGWRHEATAESLTVTTPTGHHYTRPSVPLLPPSQVESAEPTAPGEPAEPTTPAEPAEPTVAAGSTAPAEPDTPAGPSASAGPAEPTAPAEPTESGSQGDPTPPGSRPESAGPVDLSILGLFGARAAVEYEWQQRDAA